MGTSNVIHPVIYHYNYQFTSWNCLLNKYAGKPTLFNSIWCLFFRFSSIYIKYEIIIYFFLRLKVPFLIFVTESNGAWSRLIFISCSTLQIAPDVSFTETTSGLREDEVFSRSWIPSGTLSSLEALHLDYGDDQELLLCITVAYRIQIQFKTTHHCRSILP